MLKLYCVTETKAHPGDPIINGHQTGEMILEEAKELSSSDVLRLQTAIGSCNCLVEDVYRINAVNDAETEYCETMASLHSDNVEEILKAERRFHSYVLEFDMFQIYLL